MKTQEIFEEPVISVKSVMGIQKEKFSGDFFCYGMKLTSLEGSPSSTGGDFYCSNNNLASLQGCANSVGGDFNCHDNKIQSLEGGPTKVGGLYACSFNTLVSLKGAPTSMSGDFACSHNELDSLEGAPSRIAGDFICRSNNLKSLKGIYKIIKHIGGKANFSDNEISSNILGLLRIEGLKNVILDDDTVENIINKHLAGDRDIFACQEDLIDAGYEALAEL